MISYNGNVINYNTKWLIQRLPLQPKSLRLLYKPGTHPMGMPDGYKEGNAGNFHVIRLSQNPNIWDATYRHQGTSWYNVLTNDHNLIGILEGNTSDITNMENAFVGCTSLSYVATFDTSNVTNMAWMFGYCSSLVNPPMLNTSNVSNMYGMFAQCTSLETVPLYNTSSVTNMSYMFDECFKLESVPLLDTSSVTNMSHMFSGCIILLSVPLFNTSNVTNMSYMLSDCYELESIPLFNTSSVTNVHSMCSSCVKVESGALALYNQMSSQATPPSDHQWTFRDCGRDTVAGAAELAQIPLDWK